MNEGFKAVFTHPHPMWDGDVIEKEHIAWGLEPWTSISKDDMGTTQMLIFYCSMLQTKK